MSIKLITDSASDITKEMQEKYNIEIVPLKVSFGDEEYISGVTISNREFFDKLEEGKFHPKTSQINQYEFEEVFKKCSPDDDVIVFTLSKDMSGTHQSAVNAKEALGAKNIHIFDTRTVSISEGAIVLETAKLIEKGASIEEILKKIPKLIENVRVFATFETLKYLKAGGRLSGIQATIGKVLNVKIILNTKNGLVNSAEKVLSSRKAFMRIKELTSKDYDRGHTMYFGHADYKDVANEQILQFKNALDVADSQILEVGPTVGTHVGRGVFAVAYFAK